MVYVQNISYIFSACKRTKNLFSVLLIVCYFVTQGSFNFCLDTKFAAMFVLLSNQLQLLVCEDYWNQEVEKMVNNFSFVNAYT